MGLSAGDQHCDLCHDTLNVRGKMRAGQLVPSSLPGYRPDLSRVFSGEKE